MKVLVDFLGQQSEVEIYAEGRLLLRAHRVVRWWEVLQMVFVFWVTEAVVIIVLKSNGIPPIWSGLLFRGGVIEQDSGYRSWILLIGFFPGRTAPSFMVSPSSRGRVSLSKLNKVCWSVLIHFVFLDRWLQLGYDWNFEVCNVAHNMIVGCFSCLGNLF